MKHLLIVTLLFSIFNIFFSNMVSAQYRSSDVIQAERLQKLQDSRLRSTIEGFTYQCNMYDEVTVYYVMPNDEILQIDKEGTITLAGFKDRPPLGREKEFSFMLAIVTDPPITYAVDQYGQIWQNKYPYKEIVGMAKKAN
ncbi:MAG: hypothetical protein IPM47_07325 [Sphingobacteriales bacterium]|nr:MAG: hypothetical protein IPM47_07325 [Sphingobacteriales bacterium]